MATATGRVDELVKDYLLFRGFTSSVRAFETELKNDKENGLRADRIVEQLQNYIVTFDLTSLTDYWSYLSQRFFSRLEQRYMASVRKLEVGLLKHYVVNATQTNRHDRVLDFFEKMTMDLQNQPEFKDWFSYPFVKNPEENPNFMMFFNRQWIDTFYLSLTNFLSVIIQTMPAPSLLNFDLEHKRMRNLEEEKDILKQQLLSLNKKPETGAPKIPDEPEPPKRGANSMDLVYDFSHLADDNTAIHRQGQEKTSRKFPFSASPLLGKKLISTGKSASKAVDQRQQNTGRLQVKAKASKPVPGNIQNRQTRSAGAPVPTVSENKAYPPSQSSPSQSQTNQSKGGAQKTESTVPAGKDQSSNASSSLQRQKMEDYMKERKHLLGDAASKIINKRSSEGNQIGQTKSSSSADLAIKRSTSESAANKNIEMTQISSMEVKDSKSESQCPFLMLNQEEYSEHRSAISLCKFSNTGQHVASVDVDGVVKIWTWSPQPTTAATVMSKSAFLSFDWASKADRWLLLGNKSGNIRLFDVKEMKSFYEATADSSYPRIINLCASPAGGSFVCSATVNRARSGSDSSATGPSVSKVGKLTLWELRTMKLAQQLPVEPGPVAINCCTYNHNGQLLLTGAADGQIRLFDMQQYKCISQWEAHSGEILSLQFSSDETSCYSMGSDGKFICWSIHKPGQKCELPIHQEASLPFLSSGLSTSKEIPRGKLFALDSEGQYILTCDKNKGILYQTQTSKENFSQVMDILGHKSNITTVDWSPSIDTRICLTGAMDGKIRLSTLLSTHV